MFYGILAAFSVLAIVLDQVSKYLTVSLIPYDAAHSAVVQVWPGVFHLTHVRNDGMSFSLLSGFRWGFIILTVLALLFIVITIWKKWVTHPVSLWALAAIAGGAVGNLIDRAVLGYVVDMIEVEFMRFAVFNVADCFVVCGGILLAVSVLFLEKDPKKKETGHDPAQ